MQAVLSAFRTPHWELCVWATGVEALQAQLGATMKTRLKELPAQLVRVTPGAGVAWVGSVIDPASAALRNGDAVLFENQSYEFEFTLPGCKSAYVRHRAKAVCEAFRFASPVLRGTLNFGNAIGWFDLELVVIGESGDTVVYQLGFEVHATKLDMQTDLGRMLERIDSTYPLWRFSFAQMTSQSMDRSRDPSRKLPLLWLEQFKSLRTGLERNIKLICEAPHNRLQETSRRRRVDQLRGKLTVRRQHEVALALAGGDTAKRLEVTARRLSADTPENRFVLAVMDHCERELARFQQRIELSIAARRVQNVSGHAAGEISRWRRSLKSLRANRLWSEVGSFNGAHRESLVLQERAGYSGVYRSWLQLKMYLDVLGRHASISTKAVS